MAGGSGRLAPDAATRPHHTSSAGGAGRGGPRGAGGVVAVFAGRSGEPGGVAGPGRVPEPRRVAAERWRTGDGRRSLSRRPAAAGAADGGLSAVRRGARGERDGGAAGAGGPRHHHGAGRLRDCPDVADAAHFTRGGGGRVAEPVSRLLQHVLADRVALRLPADARRAGRAAVGAAATLVVGRHRTAGGERPRAADGRGAGGGGGDFGRISSGATPEPARHALAAAGGPDGGVAGGGRCVALDRSQLRRARSLRPDHNQRRHHALRRLERRQRHRRQRSVVRRPHAAAGADERGRPLDLPAREGD